MLKAQTGKKPDHMIRIALLALLFLLPAATAQAAPEAELRGVIERLLGGQKAAFEKTGGTFETNGTIMIEPAGKYYAVTLPDITLVHANKSRTALGLIALNASPAGEKKWNITMALPTPIITKDAGGQTESELSFGKQHFTGLWDENFQNFTNLKTIYENVRLSLPQQTADRPFSAATIKKLGYGFDLANTTKQKTDLLFRLGLEGISAQGLSPAYARVFPTDTTVNVDLKDLAVDKLGDIQKSLMTPEQMAGSPLGIVSLLAQSGSQATINSILIKNAQSAFNLKGQVKPAPNTPLNATGKLTLDATRMDQLILGINDVSSTLSPQDQGKLQGLRVAFTMMAALGQNVDANTKRYNVDLTEDGKIMMNGTDFTPLLITAPKTAGTKAAR